jgi:CBS domain-containing protein
VVWLARALLYRALVLLAQPTACAVSVSHLMTARPITIDASASVAAAATLMHGCRVRHLPVYEEGRFVGILSLRDVLGGSDGAPVRSVMSPAVETVARDTPVAAACERMIRKQISCVPVVDGPRLAGLFTATDALRFALEQLERDAAEPQPVARVASLLTPQPLTVVQPDTPLIDCWQQMRISRVRHLPVMRGDSCVGMLSDRDLLALGRGWLHAPTAAGALVAADAMSARVATIGVERSARDAARTLLRRRFGALPAVRGQRLVGIVTVSDFLYWIRSHG